MRLLISRSPATMNCGSPLWMNVPIATGRLWNIRPTAGIRLSNRNVAAESASVFIAGATF